MDKELKLDLSKSSPEVRASMIEAAARVYAAGLMASTNTSNSIRRHDARGDVEDFFVKLGELGE